MSVFALYRFFDAEDVLLYVGLTIDPGARFKKHRYTKPWWRDVDRIEIQHFNDLATLRAGERKAIEDEHPLHNILMSSRAAPDDLVWRCDVCTDPIKDGDGYITVSYAALESVRREQVARKEYEAAERERTGSSLVAVPITMFTSARAHWMALHRWCDPDPNSSDYWIAVHEVRTARHVIERSAHLLRKRWIQRTNWHDILCRVGRQM